MFLPGPLSSYSGKTVLFPTNPIVGYIDGSIYLLDAHNPVDVTKIEFGTIEKNTIDAKLTMQFLFEYEGIGLQNEALEHEFKIKIEG
jgi:hypothetical protein